MARKNKKITLDELARITKIGFDSVDKRFDKVEGKLDRIENDVAYLKTHLVDKYYLMDKLANFAVEIYKRLDKKLEKERESKKKITEIIKRNKLATPRELAYLERLIR